MGQNIEKNPELFRRLHQEGHMIGNHTFHHLDGWNHTEENYIRDIRSCAKVISKNGFSSNLNLFRPPYGKLKKQVIHKIRDEYQIIMWDVLSYDFSSRLSVEQMLRKSIQHTTNGSIIIFHDSEKTKNRFQFLIVQYVEHFMINNYKFSTIDKLFLSN